MINRVCLLVAIPMLALGILAVSLLYTSALGTLEQTVSPLAQIAADDVSSTLTTHIGVVEGVGYFPNLSDPTIPTEALKPFIDSSADSHGYQRGNVLDTSGKSIFDGNDYSTREYFIHGMQGQTWVSEPLTSKITGATTIIVSAPIWKDGVYGSLVTGVVYFVPKETFLNDIVSSISISSNSCAYMLDKTGNIIADRDMQNVTDQVNHIELSRTDSSYVKLAEVEKAMTDGLSGFATYRNGTEMYLIAYSPVANTNGWSLAITAPLSDFLSSTYQGIIYTAGLLIIAMICALLIMRRIAFRICDPISKCTARLEGLADGDLSSDIPDYNHRNEIGRLSDATKKITGQLSNMIGDLSTNLNNISSGDFTCSSSDQSLYGGDYSELKDAI